MNYLLSELLFYWFFPIISIVYVIVYSELFKSIRASAGNGKFGYLMACPICMGAWVGILVGVANIFSIYPRWLQLPTLGLCAGIAINFIIQLFIQQEEK